MRDQHDSKVPKKILQLNQSAIKRRDQFRRGQRIGKETVWVILENCAECTGDQMTDSGEKQLPF